MKFIFRRRFNYFDTVVFVAIGLLAAQSLGWLLLVLPAAFLSAFGEMVFGE